MPARNRAAPAVMIIVFLAILAIAAPFLARFHGDPTVWVAKIQAMSMSKPSAPSRNMEHDVWVNERSGLYYCEQSKFYRRIWPGTLMRQGAALQKGFRPAQGHPCP